MMVETTTPEKKRQLASDEELKSLRVGSLLIAWVAMIMVNESTNIVQWIALAISGFTALAAWLLKTYRDAVKKNLTRVQTGFHLMFVMLVFAFSVLTALTQAKVFGERQLFPTIPILAFLILGGLYLRLLVKGKFRRP